MAGDNTRARILETAGAVFAEKGYEEATVREICEKAGVNLAAVNYYFRGKESLYGEILERAQSCKQEEASLDWPPGAAPATKLRQFIRQLLTHMLSVDDEPWELRLIMREIANPTAAGRKVLRDHFRKGFDQLQEILDEILPPATPDHRRHQIGFSIMGQCGWYRGLAKVIPLLIEQGELKRHYGVDELADHIAQVSLAALGLGPPLVASVRETPQPKKRKIACVQARPLRATSGRELA